MPYQHAEVSVGIDLAYGSAYPYPATGDELRVKAPHAGWRRSDHSWTGAYFKKRRSKYTSGRSFQS
jgi:hypothetical protein